MEWRLDRRLRVILEVIPAAAAVAAVVIVGVTMFQTFFGDANIYLPFARNTARVDFFSFNPHMFSSGATSPLWTLVLGIPFAVGLGVTGAKVFSLLMTAASVLVVIVVAYRVTGSLAAAGLASFYLVGAVAVWGVVMFVLALTILGISLFGLSSYEAQFFGTSSDGSQAFYSAVGGIERAKFVLARKKHYEDVALNLPLGDIVFFENRGGAIALDIRHVDTEQAVLTPPAPLEGVAPPLSE